jgi:GTPase SAR1 family protein
VGEIPREIWELTYLEELILSNEWLVWDYDKEHYFSHHSVNDGFENFITGFPLREQSGSQSDTIANLHSNGLQKLSRLVLTSSQITNLRFLESLPSLTHLNLRDSKGIKDFAPVSKLSKIVELVLAGTHFNKISLLANLRKIKCLNLAFTKITSAEELSGLKNLEILDLSWTNVEAVSSLKSLGKLKIIDVRKTKVNNIDAFASLSRLEVLNIVATKVSDIGPIKRLLAKGLTIYLDQCPLVNPPQEIAVQGNEAILAYWKQLESESLTVISEGEEDRGNKFINREIKMILLGNSGAGKTSVRLFLKRNGRLRKGHDSTHGMETVIWKPIFELDRLKGISNPDKEDFKVRILDFGGQEYYHDTHHLFFTTNTAYIVIWSKAGDVLGEVKALQKRKGKKDPEEVTLFNAPLPYWLDAIEHFCDSNRVTRIKEPSDLPPYIAEAPNRVDVGHALLHQMKPNQDHLDSRDLARALVVQNKIDLDGRHFVSEDQLKHRFPIIYDFAAVSLEPPHGMRLPAFMDLLKEMMEHMPIIGQEWPMSTKYIKAALDTFDEAHYDKTREEFLEWAREKVKAATDTEAQLDMDWLQYLIPYLAQIGLLLHFPDTTHAVLKNKVFLRPDKVTGRIYEILDRLHASEGRFDRPHAWRALGRTPEKIKALIKDPESDKETETLLALMRHFRIIFLEGNDPNRFVAPLYLPGEPIRGVQLFLGLFKQPTFRVQYPGFIHKSVVLHFFEEFGPRAFSEQSASGQTLHYYWRNGIVVKDPKSPAMVLLQFAFGEEIKDKPGEYTPAHVDVFQLGGKGDIQFTREVLATIATINKGWKAKEMVTANGVDFVEVKALKAAEQAKQYTYLDKEQGKIFQLRDFKDLLEFKMPMKKVFISYSKADAAHLQALENHLSVFKRKGDIDTWNCRKLIPGEKWDGKIRQELEEADIIIFLVSADFLATDYIWDVEIKRAVERDEAGKAKVVPIIVRSCVWQDSPLGKFQSPEKAAPISSASNVDEAWTKVAENLRKIF